MSDINQKFEIEKIPSSGWILFIDGEQSACPFLPPFMIQSNMGGGPKISRVPCSTICPMAELQDLLESNIKDYVTHCGCISLKRRVTIRDEQKPQSILKSL